jgi:hypothetical protein
VALDVAPESVDRRRFVFVDRDEGPSCDEAVDFVGLDPIAAKAVEHEQDMVAEVIEFGQVVLVLRVMYCESIEVEALEDVAVAFVPWTFERDIDPDRLVGTECSIDVGREMSFAVDELKDSGVEHDLSLARLTSSLH